MCREEGGHFERTTCFLEGGLVGKLHIKKTTCETSPNCLSRRLLSASRALKMWAELLSAQYLSAASASSSVSGLLERPKRSNAGTRKQERYGHELPPSLTSVAKRVAAGEILLPTHTPGSTRDGKKQRLPLSAPTIRCPPLFPRPLVGTAPMPAPTLRLIKAELRVWDAGLGELLPRMQEELGRVYVMRASRRDIELWPDPDHPHATLRCAAVSGLTQRGVMFDQATTRLWHAAGFRDHARLVSAMNFMQPYNLELLRNDSRWANLYEEARPICDALAAAGVHVPNWCCGKATGPGVALKGHHF